MLLVTKRTDCEETFSHSQTSRLSFGSFTSKQRKMYPTISSLCSSVNTSERGVPAQQVFPHGTAAARKGLSKIAYRDCLSSFKKLLRSSSTAITIRSAISFFRSLEPIYTTLPFSRFHFHVYSKCSWTSKKTFFYILFPSKIR